MREFSCVVAVTGGGRGIGYAVCLEVLRKGGKVGVVEKDEKVGLESVESLGKEFGGDRVVFVGCDVTEGEVAIGRALEAVRERFGRLDVVCNNAGVGEGPLQQMLDINVVAVVNGTQRAIRMKKEDVNGPSVVINVSSTAGLYPLTASPAYTASKHAVVGYSRAIAPWAKRRGVLVHCICPSFTDTDLVRKGTKQEDFKYWVDKVGIMAPETVAKSIVKLCTWKEPVVIRVTTHDPFAIMFAVSKL